MPTIAAAFARLCVETLTITEKGQLIFEQPPSRGCVLKLFHTVKIYITVRAAAFARLCVETLAVHFA